MARIIIIDQYNTDYLLMSSLKSHGLFSVELSQAAWQIYGRVVTGSMANLVLDGYKLQGLIGTEIQPKTEKQ